jgi:hypothetical protein
MDLTLEDIARELRLYLDGDIKQVALWKRVSNIREAALREASSDPDDDLPAPGVALTVLDLLDLLLRPTYPAALTKHVEGAIVLLDAQLRRGTVNLRATLPKILRRLGQLRLTALGNPLTLSGLRERDDEGMSEEGDVAPEDAHWAENLDFFGSDEAPLPGQLFADQWIDVGLVRSVHALPNTHGIFFEDKVHLVPFSIFTRRFFRETLPRLLHEQVEESPMDGVPQHSPCLHCDDRFYYHPENDQAISLKERYPVLTAVKRPFQYFVGESGLAEIVIDSRAIRRRELVFAARLFCMQNALRRVSLDGRPVGVLGLPGR